MLTDQLAMSPVVALTIVTRNHLHYARAFARSLKSASPDVPVVVCVIDGGDDMTSEPFRVVRGDELDIPEWPRFRFQYLADEVCYAVKPFLLEWAMVHLSASILLYFDADILLFQPLDDLISTVSAHEIVITPQLSAPAASRESEVIARRYGVYNAGFVGVRNSEVGRSFAQWWQGWTRKHGIIDFGASLACDQAWLDLAPGLFPGVHVERGARYNLARWNLCERGLDRLPDGTWTVGAAPLVFFHFSGFHVGQCRDGSNVRWPGLDIYRFPLVRQLCLEYADRLDECDALARSRLPYGFARLSDGTEIDTLWREAVRIDHPELAGVFDPLDVRTTPNLRQRFERAAADARLSRRDWRAQVYEEEVVALRNEVEALRERARSG